MEQEDAQWLASLLPGDRDLVLEIREKFAIEGRRLRWWAVFGTPALAAIVAVTAMVLRLAGKIQTVPALTAVVSGLGAALLFIFIARGILQLGRSRINDAEERAALRGRLEALTKPAAAIGREIPVGTGEASGAAYFQELVNINVSNLRDYYALVKRHAAESFAASLVVGAIGFLLIAIGLALGLGQSDRGAIASYIASGAGVFTEFISGVFFYLYNRTVRQLKHYHDSLLNVQNILLSFKVLEDSSPEQKVTMLGQIITFLLRTEGETAKAAPSAALKQDTRGLR